MEGGEETLQPLCGGSTDGEGNGQLSLARFSCRRYVRKMELRVHFLENVCCFQNLGGELSMIRCVLWYIKTAARQHYSLSTFSTSLSRFAIFVPFSVRERIFLFGNELLSILLAISPSLIS